MLGELKRFGRETLIYGLSTVVGRLLNILLLPFYTHALVPAEYGLVATLFSYLAFLNVLYAYGMDFAYMRFGSASGATSEEAAQKNKTFSTAFLSLAATSLLFSLIIHTAAVPLSAAAAIPPGLEKLIQYAAWILAFDALSLVPFAELRLSHKASAYALIKVANIFINLALNYVFLIKMHMGVSGVFLASLAASCATFTMLTPVIAGKLSFPMEKTLYRSLLNFGLPLIPAGLASMMVQVIDRPILRALTDDATVGVYQANYRLGFFMMMVVNMFDAAWRPFFLQKASAPNGKEILARVLTYFLFGACVVVLGLSLFIGDLVALPLLNGKPLIHPDYWPGLGIVPIVLLAYLFNGAYVNFLAPVTLAKRSELVAYATGAGALVNVALNFLLIPIWGILGAALATLAAYAAMAGVLHQMGRAVYPIDYEYRRLAHIGICFGVLSIAAYFLSGSMGTGAGWALARLGLWLGFPALLFATGFFNPEERLAARRILLK